MDERLGPNHRVLEFGAGNSTLWFSKRVREVICLEDDPLWAEELTKKLPDNTTLHLVNSLDEVPLKLSDQFHSFDVVVVDGLGNRMTCAKMALQHYLSDEGVVIWDNTDGPDWPEIARLMASRHYQEISFHGMAPQIVSECRTTVFYREINVLGI